MSKSIKVTPASASRQITKRYTKHHKIDVIEDDSNDEDHDDIQNISSIDIRGDSLTKKRKRTLSNARNSSKEPKTNQKMTKEDIHVFELNDRKKKLQSNDSSQETAGKKSIKEVAKNSNLSTKAVFERIKEKLNNNLEGRKNGITTRAEKKKTPEKEIQKNGIQRIELKDLFKYDLEESSANSRKINTSNPGLKKNVRVSACQKNGIKKTEIEGASPVLEENLLEGRQEKNSNIIKEQSTMIRRSHRGLEQPSKDVNLLMENEQEDKKDIDEIIQKVKSKKDGNIWNSSRDESSSSNTKRSIKKMESPGKDQLDRRRSITKTDMNDQENKETKRKESFNSRKLRNGNYDGNDQNGSAKCIDIDRQSENLMDIGKIDEELFEVRELPKDKTRILWIINSMVFIERLMSNDSEVRKGSVFTTSNGKKWQLEISQNEEQQQIDCVLRRVFADSDTLGLTSLKQQMYYVFKFFVLSKSDPIIDKTYSASKTFSADSSSQTFNFPFDVELILEKYQHIVFELTLTPQRLFNYNSKEETGYVGLQNEGMTCYMNSFLQTVFHIKAFVRLVFSIPTEKETQQVFPHSLQTLFYQLQSRNYHCNTAGLLKSFSWDSSRAKIQQDVQEFSCLFIEFLEKKAEKIPQLRGEQIQTIYDEFHGEIRHFRNTICF